MSEEPTTIQQDDITKKIAACLDCRRSKVRCIRLPETRKCRRCDASGQDCITPDYHVGRYKGVKNKRTGLQQAIHKIEEAVKRSKAGDKHISHQESHRLSQLLDQSRSVNDQTEPDVSASDVADSATDLAAKTGSSFGGSFNGDEESDIALENAENPLQLLALASAFPNSSPATESHAAASISVDKASYSDGLETFFKPIQTCLDNAHELDPIELGLVAEDEAVVLFDFFYTNLSHTRYGLDPAVHTARFVRSRSSFLFTSVLAASATFIPDTAALCKRLSAHRDKLVRIVIEKNYRSIEIVLAFMMNIPWASPRESWADDSTCFYMSHALSIALDLSLNKIITPSSVIGLDQRVGNSECIRDSKALKLDGFGDMDVSSPQAQRLLRSRERVWLAMFVLDRGICLARGRPFAVPMTPLLEFCDTWHISPIADQWDGSIVSITVLRRDFQSLISSIRTVCDNNQLTVRDGSVTVKIMKDKIEHFFDQWYTTWSFQVNGQARKLPPYVEILVSHTKLSTYCHLMNYPTASGAIKQFFRAAGLSSAISVLQAAVRGENRLKSMPNNTVIMVSFAACFALGLSVTGSSHGLSVPRDVRSLIEEAAAVLQRIGSSPAHRNGASVPFGKYIKRILDQSANIHHQIPNPTPRSDTSAMGAEDSQQEGGHQIHAATTGMSSGSFLGMTDDQIIEAIENAVGSDVPGQDELQMDDNMFLDWLDWPNLS